MLDTKPELLGLTIKKLQQLSFLNEFYFSISQHHMSNQIYYLNFSFYTYKYTCMYYVIFQQRIELFTLKIIQSSELSFFFEFQ